MNIHYAKKLEDILKSANFIDFKKLISRLPRIAGHCSLARFKDKAYFKMA